MDTGNLELAGLAKQFEIHNSSDGKSARTVEWYNGVLDLFMSWLRAEGMSTSLDDLGEDEVRCFILHLQGRPGLWGQASSHTVNNRVRALRAFFNWLYKQGYTECHRLQNLKVPKVRQKEIETLTDEEIERIFASMNPGTVLGARNTAIYSLMLDTGLRLTELVTLKYRDVHLDKRYVKVLGKGDKERIVAFGANWQRALANYAHHYCFETEGQVPDSFFLCIDGRCMTPDALRSLREALQGLWGPKAASPPHAPHLRHPVPAERRQRVPVAAEPWAHHLGHGPEIPSHHRPGGRSSQPRLLPLDRFEMRETKRFRHRLNGDSWPGRIYPNAGRPGRPQGRGVSVGKPFQKR